MNIRISTKPSNKVAIEWTFEKINVQLVNTYIYIMKQTFLRVLI